MRDAEETAEFWCNPDEPTRCKWRYEAIVVAKLESCIDMSAGLNHNKLSMEAEERAQTLKEQIEDNDLLVAELGMLLDGAKMRFTKA